MRRYRLPAVAVSLTLMAAGASAPIPVSTQSGDVGSTFVKGSQDALAILNRVRSTGHLNEVRSLILDGEFTTPDGLLPSETNPIALKFLLPDAIQETSRQFSTSYVFSLAGRDFWQKPSSTSVETTRLNKTRVFADWSLLLLGRAPAQLPVTATVADKGRDTAVLVFTAPDYSRRAAFDLKTWRPVMIEYLYKDSGGQQARFRLTVSEFATLSNHVLPRVIMRSFRDGDAATKIVFKTILVNRDVSPKDFERR